METATTDKSALLAEKRTDLLKVDPRAIDIVEGFNVRIDMGDLHELASSIVENGVRNPLLVRRDKDNPGRFLVIEGHRRLAAVKILFKDGRFTDDMGVRVPVILEEKGSNDFDRLIDMAVTNTGKPFTPIEFAELVKRLRAYGKTDTEIAKKLGKSVTTIFNTTALLELPEDIKKAIGENKISANLVLSVFKEEKDTDKSAEIIRAAIKEGFEVIDAESQSEVSQSEEAPSKKKKKVTKAAIAKKQGKHNSVAIFKRLDEKSPVKVLPEMKEVHKIVKDILEGKLSEERMQELFYEGRV